MENKHFVKWWFMKNWQTIILFLEWLIIGSMIGGVIVWLME